MCFTGLFRGYTLTRAQGRKIQAGTISLKSKTVINLVRWIAELSVTKWRDAIGQSLRRCPKGVCIYSAGCLVFFFHLFCCAFPLPSAVIGINEASVTRDVPFQPGELALNPCPTTTPSVPFIACGAAGGRAARPRLPWGLCGAVPSDYRSHGAAGGGRPVARRWHAALCASVDDGAAGVTWRPCGSGGEGERWGGDWP